MPPKLSVVFVNYNSERFLARALESLGRNAGPVSFEALVADNASKDQEAVCAVCERFGARLVPMGRNLGYGAAANRAARLACGEYLAVANPDILVKPGALETLVRFLDANPDAGAAGPRLVYPDGTFHPSARRMPSLRYILAGRRSPLLRFWPGYPGAREFLYLGAEKAGEPVRVESVVGAFIVFRRSDFDTVGGFDEHFFMYAEDTDICRRLGRDGQVFLVPGALVVHSVGESRRRARRFTEYHRLRSHRLFFREGAGTCRRALLEVLFAAYAALYFAAGAMGLGEREYSWTTKRKRGVP